MFSTNVHAYLGIFFKHKLSMNINLVPIYIYNIILPNIHTNKKNTEFYKNLTRYNILYKQTFTYYYYLAIFYIIIQVIKVFTTYIILTESNCSAINKSITAENTSHIL